MSRIQKFTPALIDQLTDGKLPDPLTSGLYIEVQRGGSRKAWKYRRRIAGSKAFAKSTLGPWPRHSIADARAWAAQFNEATETGVDPRAAAREAKAREITVSDAHAIYMRAMTSGVHKVLKARTLADKQAIFNRDLKPSAGDRMLQSLTVDDLDDIVQAKAQIAPRRAKLLGAEIKVFMKWCARRASRSLGIHLETDPAAGLELDFARYVPRSRRLSDDELGWLFRVLVDERVEIRRAVLMVLLTGCRREEVLAAPMSEFDTSKAGATIWTLPGSRTKNGREHRVALGEWGSALCAVRGDWLIKSPRKENGPQLDGWSKIMARLATSMSKLAKKDVAAFGLHDLRRTLRSNTLRLGIDYEVAESMINHKKKGLDAVYDHYEMADEKRDGWARWEAHLIGLARKVGVADQLGVPPARKPTRARGSRANA